MCSAALIARSMTSLPLLEIAVAEAQRRQSVVLLEHELALRVVAGREHARSRAAARAIALSIAPSSSSRSTARSRYARPGRPGRLPGSGARGARPSRRCGPGTGARSPRRSRAWISLRACTVTLSTSTCCARPCANMCSLGPRAATMPRMSFDCSASVTHLELFLRGGRDDLGVEALADERRDLQQIALRRSELGDARGDDAAQRLGHVDVGDVAVVAHLAFLERHRAGVLQRLQVLLDVERVAAALGRDLAQQVERDLVGAEARRRRAARCLRR